ncbi:DUF2589 domain-containing protein [Pedobacter frigiditerrae]|uniref:DUF2589 domain-containing protein n=1 Tax=Pedobacter frigiditerrae TaxID=2530452 RepID=A0A4R0MSU4_9SPHI|nr:DUF2589 domain-containing protein [Pedobacter frigiditerrae]TCC90060.1 DUF2589 domain-containing protein [Pedobacter frigiditerrae]
MISFKLFVNAIQEAIISASDALMDKNTSLLDKYFIEAPKAVETHVAEDEDKEQPNVQSAATPNKHTLVPRTVILEYPHLGHDGEIENLEISVPLITLVPLTMSKIDKATLTASFRMAVVNGEVQLDLGNEGNGGLFKKKPKMAWGKIEISLAPQETSEGYKLLVEGYEAILKRQIS